MDFHVVVEAAGRFVSLLFGIAVGGGAFYLVWMRSATRWRLVARVYPAPPLSNPSAELRLETVILHSGGIAFNHFGGIVTARVYKHGVELILMPPFSVAHPPIYMPYDEIALTPCSWYLVGRTSELKTLRPLEGVKVIIHDTLARAIEAQRSQSQSRVAPSAVPAR